MNCYYCEIEPATSTHFGKASCTGCKIDIYIINGNPLTITNRTDEQNASRQKMMRQAFVEAFNEDGDRID